MSAHPGYYDHPSCPTPFYKTNRMDVRPRKIKLRKHTDYKTPKGTKVHHTVDNRIPKTLEGHKPEVFHPPKIN